MYWLFTLLASYVSSDEILSDGEVKVDQSPNEFGSQKYYQYLVGSVSSNDLVISLSSYSDNYDPDLYIKSDSYPTFSDYEYISRASGSESIVISSASLVPGRTYYIMVLCYTYCHYSLSATMTNEVVLIPGVPITSHLDQGREALYYFNTSDSPGEVLSVKLATSKGLTNFYISVGEENMPGPESSEKTEMTWDGNEIFRLFDFKKNEIIRIAIQALQDSDFVLGLYIGDLTVRLLQTGVAASDEVLTGSVNYYYFPLLSPNIITISLTVFSGDADLWVRFNHYPNSDAHDFSSSHFGNENFVITYQERQRLGAETGNCYIAVVGVDHSSYKLTVTTSNSTVVGLKRGEPQSGSVSQGKFMYFSLEVKEDSQICVSLAAELGDPNLYMMFCVLEPNKCLIKEKDIMKPEVLSSSSYTGNEFICVNYEKINCPESKSSCFYVIAVYGVNVFSTFTLNAVLSPDDEIWIQEGKTVDASLQDEVFKSFKFSVNSIHVDRVDIILTPVYGEPDLFGSLDELVDENHYQKSSFHKGIEVDQITWVKGTDFEILKGIYNLKVACYEKCSFRITAKSTVSGIYSAIELISGHSLKDTLSKESLESRYYSFKVQFDYSKEEDLILSLTAISGQFNLYIANNENAIDTKTNYFNYNWVLAEIGDKSPSSSILIKANSPAYKSRSTYLIKVMAFKFLADNSATFSVSFRFGNKTTSLTHNLPFSSQVDLDQYDYFTYPLLLTDDEVVISVTALSGDCDLFIKIGVNETRPSTLKYDFKSNGIGNDKLTLNLINDINPKCQNREQDSILNGKTGCYLFIAVFGYKASVYNIKVLSNSHLPSILMISQPTHHLLSQNSEIFHYSIMDFDQGFTISIQNDYGDADIFVNIFDKHSIGGKVEGWDFPTNTSNQFSSQNPNNIEKIEVSFNTLIDICSGGSCIILSTVKCKTTQCSFFIQINTFQGAQVLIENQPTYAVSSKQFQYFKYTNNLEDNDLFIYLTQLDCPNYSIFVSKGDNYPTFESYDWSVTYPQDRIFILNNDEKLKGSIKGSFLIGVVDSFGTCSFSLIVNNHINRIMKLISGTPQSNILPGNSVNFYSYFNSIQQDIVISITPKSGTCSTYISTQSVMSIESYDVMPGPNNHFWSSFKSADPYNILISTQDPRFCVNCSILISVNSNTSEVSYVITVKNSVDSILLQNGVPMRQVVKGDKKSLYSFIIHSQVNFAISITSYTLISEFYITPSVSFSKINQNWGSSEFTGSKTIHIFTNQLGYATGTFFIIVKSQDFALFTIVAYTQDSTISLIEGWPLTYSHPSQSFSINTNAYFTYSSHNKLIYCTLKAFTNDLPRVISKSNELNNDLPTLSNFEFSWNRSDYLIDSQFNSSVLYMNFKLIKSSSVSFAVLFNENSNKDEVIQITCSSSSMLTLIHLEDVNYVSINKEIQSKRYELVAPSKGKLTVFLIPCRGDFKLEISSLWNEFTQDSPDIVVSGMANGEMIGTVNNAEGSYFLTVSSKKQLTSELTFQLFVVFRKAGNTETIVEQPGQSGLIMWQDVGNSKVSLEWKPIQNEAGEELKGNINYKIFFIPLKTFKNLIKEDDKNVPYVMDASCPYRMLNLNLIKETKDIKTVIKLSQSKGFIVILAHDKDSRIGYWKDIVYDPTEIMIVQNQEIESKNLFFVYGLGILLTIAILLILYLWKKSKFKNTILDYEMSDISNIGTSKKINEGNEGKYQVFN